MIPKEIRYNLHYDYVRGDCLRPRHYYTVGRFTNVEFGCRNCFIINIKARTSPVAIEIKGRDYGALQKNLRYDIAYFQFAFKT